MGRYNKLSNIEIIKRLKQAIKSFIEIGGFSLKIINSYKKQLNQVEKEVKEDRKKRKLRRSIE